MRGDIELIDTIVYAGRLKDRNELMKSSSGGAFTALSDVFLNRGDLIVCSTYNFEKHIQEFSLITTREQRDAARGSKYMQSKTGKVFRECANWLKQNKEKNVLFVGMGCQAEGFRKYIEVIGLRERAFIVDMVCHGVPSPKIWNEYIQKIERCNGSALTTLNFKDKRNGWKNPTAIATMGEKEVFLDKYVAIFYNRCALRPSCHECPYATVERKTDITIGDFWHIEETIPDFYDSAGNSLFLIHTTRGVELFDEIKSIIDYRESNTKECWQMNLETPTPISTERVKFWKSYNRYGINYIINKDENATFGTRLKNKLKRIMILN